MFHDKVCTLHVIDTRRGKKNKARAVGEGAIKELRREFVKAGQVEKSACARRGICNEGKHGAAIEGARDFTLIQRKAWLEGFSTV